MGDNVVPFNHPMTPELALKRIRQAASRETDKIGFTDHALMDRMGDDIWSGRWSRSYRKAR